jgi:hypothetical protein
MPDGWQCSSRRAAEKQKERERFTAYPINGPPRWGLCSKPDTHGSVLLTIDTTPNYTDTQPWPTAKTIWTYKAIYRADDAQVGHWSQPVSVTVGG